MKREVKRQSFLPSIYRISNIGYDHYRGYKNSDPINFSTVANLAGQELLKKIYRSRANELQTIVLSNRRIGYKYIVNNICIVEWEDQNSIANERDPYTFSEYRIDKMMY